MHNVVCYLSIFLIIFKNSVCDILRKVLRQGRTDLSLRNNVRGAQSIEIAERLAHEDEKRPVKRLGSRLTVVWM